MEFKISKSVFNNALSIVTKAISSVAPIPSLSGVKISVKKDHVDLIGSDSDISILKTVKLADPENKLEIIEEGSVVLDARYISEIARKMDSEIITIEIIDGTLVKISGLNVEFKINGMRASDYPEISFETVNKPNKMNVSTFEKIVRQTVFACSDKESRPALMGVNFKAEGLKLVCNATNSFRLATKKVDLENELDFNITIPAKTLNSVVSIMAENREFDMIIDPNKISFVCDDTTIRARLIDDLYPDVSRLIPASFSQVLEINTRELLDAIERTSFIKSDGKNVVKMSIDADRLDLSSNSLEIGSSHETLEIISFSGNPITISCSGKYLSDTLKTISNSTAVLNFSGELKPIVIYGKDDDSLTQLISPIRS